MLDEYIAMGYCVIPLVPNGKKPAIEWTKYQHHKPSEETIHGWFADSQHNIGIVTGRVSNLVVVDIDTYRGGKIDDVLQKYPTGRVAKTGGGGFHLYYKHPGVQVQNQVGKDGIDIRGDGGLVVAPPSIHSNGASYEWIANGEPAPFPPQLLERAKDEKKEIQQRWLSQSLGGVYDGHRNDTCAKLAGYFISRGLPIDVIRGIMANWNKNNRPPMAEYDMSKTIDSVHKTHSRRTDIEFDLEDRLPLTPMADFIDKYEKDTETWLIRDWLPSSTICFMVADPQSYKSWLMYDLAVSIACGVPFLGVQPQQTGPVIMMQLEDSSHMTANRNIAILNSKVGGKRDIDVHWLDGDPFSLEEDMGRLAASIEEIRPRVVLMDPLYAALGGDSIGQYMADVASKLSSMRTLRDKYQCTFIIAHHTKKSKTGGAGDMWGSNLLNAAKEAMWMLQIDEEGTNVKIQRRYKAAASPADVSIAFDIDTTSEDKSEWTYKTCLSEFVVDTGSGSGPSAWSKVLQAIRDGKKTTGEIEKHTGLDRRTIKRKNAELIERGLVSRQGQGSNTHYVLTEEGSHDFEF